MGFNSHIRLFCSHWHGVGKWSENTAEGQNIFSPFFASAHLCGIVCVFLVLVNWKTIMLCFLTYWHWHQIREDWIRHNKNSSSNPPSVFEFFSSIQATVQCLFIWRKVKCSTCKNNLFEFKVFKTTTFPISQCKNTTLGPALKV